MPSHLPEEPPHETPVRSLFARIRVNVRRHPLWFFLASSVLIAASIVLVYAAVTPKAPRITQKDIDSAVKYTLEHLPPAPSPAALSYAAVAQSVVRVEDFSSTPAHSPELAVGTGVVVQSNGTILTALHVVAGAGRIGVVFANGLRSDADLISALPQHDLAILKARVVPDDLEPATIGSTAGLVPGDRVIAVGYPFGIGPSVTAGVISGLNREYLSPEGKQKLTNLIQFDAAVNPGNSGGPLVTEDGSVVGIVTAILNPTTQRVFIGIGFAVPIETALGGIGEFPF